ncbi:MAG: hypothetical protein AAFX87_18680, partial [Bacteroidota bacterium]
MDKLKIKIPYEIGLNVFWTFNAQWVASPVNPTAYDNKWTLLKTLLSQSRVLVWLQEFEPWIKAGRLRNPRYKIGIPVKSVKNVVFCTYLLLILFMLILPIYGVFSYWSNKPMIILCLIYILFIYLHYRKISKTYTWELLWRR